MSAVCRKPSESGEPAPAPATHYLHPSAIFASAEPHLVTTVLGTCVSVCLWDRVRKIGGINHYMLPLWNGAGLASPKFGNIAIERLIERMEELGCARSNLVAKVFGGKSSDCESSLLNVGERNARLAEVMLEEAGIEIVGCNLGGPCGRKLLFNTTTGVVLLRRVAGLASVDRPAAR
jgi:chemotaxis protein CheD